MRPGPALRLLLVLLLGAGSVPASSGRTAHSGAASGVGHAAAGHHHAPAPAPAPGGVEDDSCPHCPPADCASQATCAGLVFATSSPDAHRSGPVRATMPFPDGSTLLDRADPPPTHPPVV